MSKPDDRLLTVPELAAYLQMSERTVLKLAVAGTLPGAKLAGEWRFKRDLVDEWLNEQMAPEEEEDEAEAEPDKIPDGMSLPLADLLEERSILADLEAREPMGVIEALAARAYANGWLHDKPWFVGAVVEREALSSTAIDGGIAFLHTRQRNAGKVARPFIVFGRSRAGVDFHAPDGKPTYLFFLLGLKYDRLHLPILGRLARILRRPEVVRALRAAPTATRLRETLLQEDAKALAAAARATAMAKIGAEPNGPPPPDRPPGRHGSAPASLSRTPPNAKRRR